MIPLRIKNYSLSPLIAGIDDTCEIIFLWYYPYLKSTKYPSYKSKLIQNLDHEIWLASEWYIAKRIWTNIFLKIWKIVGVLDPKLKIQKVDLRFWYRPTIYKILELL